MKLMTLSFVAASALSFSFLGFDKDQDIPQSQVPSVVLNAVTSAYPSATNIDWEKQKDIYEAEFDIDTKDYTVLLSSTGNVLKTKYDVAETELPAAIKNLISSNYKNYILDDVDVVEQNGRKYYQVELDGKLTDKKLVLDEAGKEQGSVKYWD